MGFIWSLAQYVLIWLAGLVILSILGYSVMMIFISREPRGDGNPHKWGNTPVDYDAYTEKMEAIASWDAAHPDKEES